MGPLRAVVGLDRWRAQGSASLAHPQLPRMIKFPSNSMCWEAWFAVVIICVTVLAMASIGCLSEVKPGRANSPIRVPSKDTIARSSGIRAPKRSAA